MGAEIFNQDSGPCRIITVNPHGMLDPVEVKMSRITLIGNEIFVPAIVVDMDERLVAMAAANDGVQSAYADGMLWVPADWAEKQLPQTGDLVALFREYVEMFRRLLDGAKS